MRVGHAPASSLHNAERRPLAPRFSALPPVPRAAVLRETYNLPGVPALKIITHSHLTMADFDKTMDAQDDYAIERRMSRDVAELDDKRARLAGPSGVAGLLKNPRLFLIAMATAQGGLCYGYQQGAYGQCMVMPAFKVSLNLPYSARHSN